MRNIGMMGIVLEGKFRDGIRVLRAKSRSKCSGRASINRPFFDST